MSRDALIVGINTYQYLPSLQAPAKDAEAIAQRLHSYGEFRVHRLPEIIQSGKSQVGQKTPVTLQELETALINLFKPKGNNPPHTALFYFSGHGIQRDAGIQEGYLAVSDANPDKGFCGLSLFWLRRLLQESPVRQRIVILDCCHSGELLNFLEADPGAQAGTDRLFMAASKEYETAYESLDSPYSVFTQALITGLDPNRLEAGVVTNHSLTDWVNHALKGEIQQPLFESSGSEIILTRGTGGQPSPIKTLKPLHICPYRGLEFFDEAHAEFFFGREELTAQLIDQLKTERFAAVSGASGSGKSSLLRAGVISRLQQEKTPAGANAWKIKLLTPTEHPLKSLAAAFIDPELSELERAEQLRRAEAFLQDGGVGLAQLVRASLAVEGGTTGLSPKERPQLLLVIDQFEEVFYVAAGHSGGN
ncbi:MAG: caspase family protein [Leptolyngbyaceae cyanobacterium CSU_1_4]|nr:caspase family protein [Leptolyngbyaceae cyanobacterium CSU_1_4]